jgi:hypothetical protein
MLDLNGSNPSSDKRPLRPDGLIGLKTLKRTLERDFFAEVSVDVILNEKCKADLVIHLDCNFSLTESLFHLNNGNWGSFRNSISGDVRTSPFQTTLMELENKNGMAIRIKELSIHLSDTSIIVSELPDCQIQDNLESILDCISENFVHFTKGMSEMPYEIFVPIFEETENSISIAEKKHHSTKSDYLKYWGLYFDGENDALVYDVHNKVIIEQSNFFLFNEWA